MSLGLKSERSWEYLLVARGQCKGTDGKFTASKTANPSTGIAYKQTVKVHQHSVTLAVCMFGRTATLSISELCGECEKLRGFLRA